MKQCISCFTQNADSSKVCASCGNDLSFVALRQSNGVFGTKYPLKVFVGIALAVPLVIIILFESARQTSRRPQNSQSSTATIVDANTSQASNKPPIQSPTPVSFEALKKDAESLLGVDRESYENVELARYDETSNGLRSIPSNSKDYKSAQSLLKKVIDKSSVIAAERVVLGKKPHQSEWDGDVRPVKDYLKQVLNDYDSSEFVEWSPVIKGYIGKEPFWVVRLRLRAKNAFGAYMLRDTYYYIRNDQVIIAKGLGSD